MIGISPLSVKHPQPDNGNTLVLQQHDYSMQSGQFFLSDRLAGRELLADPFRKSGTLEDSHVLLSCAPVPFPSAVRCAYRPNTVCDRDGYILLHRAIGDTSRQRLAKRKRDIY